MDRNAALGELSLCVGSDHVLTEANDVEAYAVDWRHKYRGSPLAVVRPATTDEVAKTVRIAARHGLSIVPQGGNTGLAGGATPDASGTQIILSTKRLNRIRDWDLVGDTVTVDAGVLLETLQVEARARDRLFPLSLAAEGSCTIGGNLATNAGGTAVLRYGNARALALGLEVVTADGMVWNGLRCLRKDNTGLDLRDLFIGSEGVLGVITGATLQLHPQPRAIRTAMLALSSLGAVVEMFAKTRELLGALLTSFEVISKPCFPLLAKHFPQLRYPFESQWDAVVLVEVSDPDNEEHAQLMLEKVFNDGLSAGFLEDGVVAESESQSLALWSLRESVSEAQGLEGAHVKHDVALPIKSLVEFVEKANAAVDHFLPGTRCAWFGHVGDGNLHYNLLSPPEMSSDDFVARQPELNRIVHDLVNQMDGSISAEHGLGQLRNTESARYKSEIEMHLMRRVKDALDPSGRMNPGKVFPPAS